jgi:hypothetical protein
VFAELRRFGLLKFIFSLVSSIVLGLFLCFGEIECLSCSRSVSFFTSVFHFVVFTVVIFMIVWGAYSFVVTLRK